MSANRKRAGRRIGVVAILFAAAALAARLLAGGPALAADAAPGAAAVAVDVPAMVMPNLPFAVTLERPESTADMPSSYRLTTAGGRVLAEGTLAPGASAELAGLTVTAGDELPLVVEAGWGGDAAVAPRYLPGWVSLLPPLVAIGLALIFHEVVLSLFVGIWVGAFLYTGLDPVGSLWRVVDRFALPAMADVDNATILMFSLLLGGMVGVISRSGGTQGIVEALHRVATTPRRGQVAAWLSGLLICFDDYANVLIRGTTLRPITDRLRISREKLAYIIDSTAAPVAGLCFISTWVGFEMSVIREALDIAAVQPGVSAAVAAELQAANPFQVFIHTIPYRFYPVLAILLVLLVALSRRDFGPMREAEQRAGRGDGVHRKGARLLADTSGGAMDPVAGAPHRWYNAGVPVLTVIVTVLAGLYIDGRAGAEAGASIWAIFGEADSYKALLWGSFAGCIVAIGMALAQRILTPQGAIDAWLGGLRAMLLACVILVLAWSISDVTKVLGTATYLSGMLSEALSPRWLPALTFVLAAAISFATGTSYGTMGILMPIAVPLAVAMGEGAGFDSGEHYSVLLGVISSVLAGAIFGDHCSPISDTTVMSSMSSACDHIDHVRTQLPYALLVAVVAVVLGDVATSFGMHLVFTYVIGGAIFYGVLRVWGRPAGGEAARPVEAPAPAAKG